MRRCCRIRAIFLLELAGAGPAGAVITNKTWIRGCGYAATLPLAARERVTVRARGTDAYLRWG